MYDPATSKLAKRVRNNLKVALGYGRKQVSINMIHGNRISATIKDKSIDLDTVQEVVGDFVEVHYHWDI